ncbi:MAG TPA: hypothetical protein VJU18_13400, partial [Vicinamibacteria bacterium]|nr:hypothetical protein [Vicinamibacteria bacterium]
QAVSWTCIPAGGVSCTPAGSGSLSDTVNLPSGGSATYTATGLLVYGTMLPIFNTATAASPLFDPLLANNSSTATTLVDPDLIFKDGFQ